MEMTSIGNTGLGLPILSYQVGKGAKHILILGGVHGDEIEGVAFSLALLEKCRKEPIQNLKITFIPTFNLDGVLLKTRVNARGVDLNRNLPTNDWKAEAFSPRYPPGDKANSEIENQALTSFIEKNKIDFIFSFHSFSKYLLNVNGNCEPLASFIHKRTGYPIEPTMGYPTPGCLGTYTGIEKNIPTITYELERGKDIKLLVEQHLEAVYQALPLVLEK
jgi:murein peptide amidase A